MVVGERGTRWIFGFDGGCGTCGDLARELVELSDGKLTARSLRSAEVQAWRERALGPDAPWAPTLFAIDEAGVRAWTGNALIARLGRLVGPHKLWRIATLVGGLMDQPAEPFSPSRRLVIRQGLAGTAAAFALLSGTSTSSFTALAQTDDPKAASTSGKRSLWSSERLKNADFEQLARRADQDRSFGTIQQYFAKQRDWRGGGRDGFRYLYDGKRVRDSFVQHFKEPGEKEWAHVIFVREDNGRGGSHAYLWRGQNRNFTDEFYVQNGNLRRRNVGRVDTQAVGAADFWDWIPGDRCDWWTIGCGGVAHGPCVITTAGAAAACPATLGTACVPLAVGTAACWNFSNDVRNGCTEDAGC